MDLEGFYGALLEKENKFEILNEKLVGLFFDLQGLLKPEMSLEIGAFEAEFSKKMRSISPFIPVLAFEANPYNYKHFTNQYDYAANHISYLHNAISDLDGTLDFNIQEEIVSRGQKIDKVIGSNSILNRTNKDVLCKQVSVPSYRLDTYLKKNSRDHLEPSMWIDVEGANRNILEGAAETLSRAKSVFIEVEDFAYWENQWLSKDVVSYLARFGLIPVARDLQYGPNQYNYIFVRKDLASQESVLGKISKFYTSL